MNDTEKGISADLVHARRMTEALILKTPTGPKRNALTEVNLHLMEAQTALGKVLNHTDEP